MSFKRPQVSFEIAGVNALLMRFGDELNPQLPAYLSALRAHLLGQFSQIIEQVVPAYTTMLVEYDPRQCRMYDLQLLLERALDEVTYDERSSTAQVIEVPVVYGGERGPDLEDVARACDLTTEEVIALHSDATYQVYAQGFAPGFSYLGSLAEEIRLPRRDTPRQKVAAGSVAIAEQQTAVYTHESPGGWHIIGYSPMQWFDPKAEPMTPMQVGDSVKFVRMDEKQMQTWLRENAREQDKEQSA